MTKKKKKTTTTSKPTGIYRSKLESKVASFLRRSGLPFEYEAHWLNYYEKGRRRGYLPDFYLPTLDFFIEVKGYWDLEDRKKHLLVRRANKDTDIRMLFQNPRNKINKKSKTTYGMYCKRHGMLYCGVQIPPEWLVDK